MATLDIIKYVLMKRMCRKQAFDAQGLMNLQTVSNVFWPKKYLGNLSKGYELNVS